MENRIREKLYVITVRENLAGLEVAPGLDGHHGIVSGC